MAKRSSNKSLQDQVLAVATMRAEELLTEKQKTLQIEIETARSEVATIEEEIEQYLLKRPDIEIVRSKMTDMVAAYNTIERLAQEAGLPSSSGRELHSHVSVHDERTVSLTMSVVIAALDRTGDGPTTLFQDVYQMFGDPTRSLHRRTFVVKDDEQLSSLLAAHSCATKKIKELENSSTQISSYIADFSRYERKLRGRVAELELKASEEGRKMLESILADADSIQGLLADLR